MAKNKKSGLDKFNEYYQDLYQDRWPLLKEALLKEKESSISIPDLQSPYYLDRASFDTANLLPVSKGMSVLDMCAAPGGKSLVLAKKLSGEGLLVSNDKSPDRRQRLRNVMNDCLTPEEREIVRITGYDASSWGVYEKDIYDAILLDAPCSSERHVLNSPEHLSIWSESRPKRLSVLQYAMLSSALLAAKSGGYILYSTCSINEKENSGVISKLVKKHGEEIELVDIEIPGCEKLDYGILVLPDKADGKGPMYACLIRKI